MAPPTTGVTDHSRHAVAADVPWLAAHTAQDVTEGAAVDLGSQSCLWTSASEVPRDIAEVADGVICAFPGYVARLTAVVAGTIIGAVNSNVAWLEAVVA